MRTVLWSAHSEVQIAVQLARIKDLQIFSDRIGGNLGRKRTRTLEDSTHGLCGKLLRPLLPQRPAARGRRVPAAEDIALLDRPRSQYGAAV